MSTNVDNVYSNAGRKGLNKQEERGYKVRPGKCNGVFCLQVKMTTLDLDVTLKGGWGVKKILQNS